MPQVKPRHQGKEVEHVVVPLPIRDMGHAQRNVIHVPVRLY